MRTTTFALAGVLALGFLSSCHDDDPPLSAAATALTRKTWNGLYKVEVIFTGKTDTLMWLEPAACRQDDFFIYRKDGTYTGDAGADNCNDQETSSTGTWSLSDDDKIITINDNASTVGANVSEISFPDENTFVLTDVKASCCFDTDGDQVGDTEGKMIYTIKAR